MDGHNKLKCPCPVCYKNRTIELRYGTLLVQKDRAEARGDHSEVMRLQNEMDELTKELEELEA